MLMLVLLRITLGWHFLYAGLWKIENSDFSSEGFLGQSKGPMAETFLGLIPDQQGLERLKGESTLADLQNLHDRFASHYSLDEKQKERSNRFLKHRQEQVSDFLKENDDAIQKYRKEVERFEAMKENPSRETPFMQKRLADKRNELQAQVKPWLAELQSFVNSLDADLQDLLTADQKKIPTPASPHEGLGVVDLAGAAGKALSQQEELTLAQLDRIVIYTNIGIGICLIAGLFTRLAAFGGALFLLQIVLANPDWPGLYPPPHPSVGRSLFVTKEFVEMMAMFVLAATPVGRWGGLDFFIQNLLIQPLFGRKEAK